MKNIILVSVGTFQNYILDNIQQLTQLGFSNIHVITEKINFKNFIQYDKVILVDADKLDTSYFDKNSKLNKSFRNGFWNFASKRFFLMYEYIKNNNIIDIIHLENDVLLYTNMNYNFDEKIYITMDSKNRCIPGIIYIPNYLLLSKLIEQYNFSQNDMINLAGFYYNNKDIVKTFPIIDDSIDKCIYNENYKQFSSIFDGAAIGQYLGGVDPRNNVGNTIGFVNETCIIKYDKYNFKWLIKKNGKFPYIEINKKLIPINNLHIHCKDLKKFINNNIKMDNQIKLDNILIM